MNMIIKDVFIRWSIVIRENQLIHHPITEDPLPYNIQETLMILISLLCINSRLLVDSSFHQHFHYQIDSSFERLDNLD
jgi:hypothetical protein